MYTYVYIIYYIHTYIHIYIFICFGCFHFYQNDFATCNLLNFPFNFYSNNYIILDFKNNVFKRLLIDMSKGSDSHILI